MLVPQILAYLEAFADRFQLHQHIKLNTRVLKVDPVAADTVQQTPHGADNPCNGMTPMRQHPIGSTTPSNAIQPEQAVVHGSLQCHCQASAALQWKVTTHSAQMAASGQEQLDGPQQQQQQEWLFDAVVSCVGIFSEPNLPQVRPQTAVQPTHSMSQHIHARYPADEPYCSDNTTGSLMRCI